MVFSAMHVFRRVKLLLWALFLAVAVSDGSAAATLSAEVSAESVFLGDAFTLAISLDGAPAPGGSPAIENTQGCAIVQDGEKTATEKTGRSGALPWIGEGWYRRRVEVPADAEYAALLFDGAMSEPEVFWDGVKVGEWKCGYNAFVVDVGGRLSPGASHLLEVRCRNRPVRRQYLFDPGS